jgi:hypothetical protein
MVHAVRMNHFEKAAEQFPAMLCYERDASDLALLESLIRIKRVA